MTEERTIVLKQKNPKKQRRKLRQKRRIFTLLACFGLAAAANLSLFHRTDLYAEAENMAVVFALDTSISMAGTPLENAKAAVWESLYTLREQTPAAFLTFSDRVTAETPLSGDREALLSLLHSAKAHGGTDITAALLKGESLLLQRPEESAAKLLLFTDGRDGEERIDPVVTARLREEGITVYVVGILGDKNKELQQLTTDTGGVFVTAGPKLNRLLSAVRWGQERERAWLLFFEGLLEAVLLFFAFEALHRLRQKSIRRAVPNAGYMKSDEIRKRMEEKTGL